MNKNLNVFFKKIIKDAQNVIEQSKPKLFKEIVSTAQYVFPEEQIKLSPASSGVELKIISKDPDFLKKEFGSDEYHPANRRLILTNMLQQKR